jgi:hypothetical protein
MFVASNPLIVAYEVLHWFCQCLYLDILSLQSESIWPLATVERRIQHQVHILF